MRANTKFFVLIVASVVTPLACAGLIGTFLNRNALMTQKPYAVAILDHLMPGDGGEALAEKISTSPTLKGTKLILLSSSGDSFPREKLGRLGLVRFLLKPARQSQLFDAVATALGESARAASIYPVANAAAFLTEAHVETL